MILARILVVAAVLYHGMVDMVTASIMPNPIGETIPGGDITIATNENLEIICSVYGNTSGGELKFTSDKYDVSRYVSKVNETTIRLYIEHPKPECRMYHCLKGNDIVDENYVAVIVKPNNMKCISYNYERLKCSFKALRLPINTKYEANYELIGRRFNNRKWVTVDNVITRNDEDYYFVLNESTPIQYRPAYGQIRIVLHISVYSPEYHAFKDFYLEATFDETKHVIPGPAENLKVTSTTAQYVEIRYNLPSEMDYISYSVQHMIFWSCICGRKHWDGKDSFNVSTKSTVYQMKDLPFAYALCNISVSLKVATAAYNDMWSNNSTLDNIRSGSKAPETPPEILEGAFQIGKRLNKTYAVIYWKEVAEELRNGPNFNYSIHLVEASGSEDIHIENNFALLKNLNVSKNNTVEIRSKNSAGTSNKTTFVIPNINNTIVRELDSFTQWTNYSGTTYLSWELPKITDENISKKWTVFACKNWSEETRLCYGQLEAVNVTKAVEENVYYVSGNSTGNKKYALTFKTEQSWTGLLWTMCSIQNKGLPLPEIHLSIVHVGATKLGLKWILSCKDMVVPISGYVLSYCKAPKTKTKCAGEIKNITIKGDRTVQHFEIANLEYETQYLIWVRTETDFGKEQRSRILPYFNEHKPEPSRMYWIIALAIITIIILGFFFKMIYEKTINCKKIDVIMPSGLRRDFVDRHIDDKSDNGYWSIYTKVQEISPINSESRLSRESSVPRSINSSVNENVEVPFYVVVGSHNRENQTTNPPNNHSTQYVSLGKDDRRNGSAPNLKAGELSNNSQYPYVVTANLDKIDVLSQGQYIPLKNFQNTTEEVPLLELPASQSVCLEPVDRTIDHSTGSIPYVTLGNTDLTSYSDTPV